jgi:hypothetical protein
LGGGQIVGGRGVVRMVGDGSVAGEMLMCRWYPFFGGVGSADHDNDATIFAGT